MLRYLDLVRNCLPGVKEIMPWDLVERIGENPDLLILDVREPYEFALLHIRESVNVPRGILESACEWDYEETVPELVKARMREIIVVCRSGYRSVLAVHSMQLLGYEHAVSLRTGLRGWNDYEEPLWSSAGSMVEPAEADDYFMAKLRADQRSPGV
ncbi:rhodanese-like domain-containing protein [Pelodictyon phaeoclathratiforme]|jgi:rhodanese-related sulfurtransferase|uniref:Rhodanese domain protein n=1 Tax=Pelodictyon phaeoclathratiforme (strain DSM 5477 / BU-1) TaxID=324925 RepID=B4SEA1_PELPB|nr:rhodanese-like domain-containing protein [Pelodictyon phaeoclathratiforme]ACF44520.1 Rhodanese domain protein [Pelodictyon phaeoclathratiforme BU-1]MBV5290140.1 rhodanese-like domain-containing protein [Pelodictyon phaeoclathratiforme]